MVAAKAIRFGLMLGLWTLISAAAHAEQVIYTLENVVLEEAGAQMFGTFTWDYEIGDFENGVGEFTFLEIPFTYHDHTDLEAEFDVGNSVEITYPGNVHDDGVDITLFLLEPLTPTTAATIDLDRSRYEIGGNGFHTGFFVSGVIAPVLPTGVGDEASAGAPTVLLRSFPNPFNPHATLSAVLSRPGPVWLSIHDARGRRVASLADGVYSPAGEFVRQWDGRDERGAEMGSGLYFAHLLSQDDRTTIKMVLLR